MYNIKNLLENDNIHTIAQKGPVQILEHKRFLGVDKSIVGLCCYANEMNYNLRQVLINLDNSSFILDGGAMQWMLGKIKVDMQANGYFLETLAYRHLSQENKDYRYRRAIYTGTGLILTEPTIKHIGLIDLDEWGGELIVEQKMFLGCESSIQVGLSFHNDLSATIAGNEGIFCPKLSGYGIALVKSPHPMDTLVEIELDNEVLCIDGSMAIAWSDSLEFTVEMNTNNIVTSIGCGEGLVNVYRGTGRVLLALSDNSLLDLNSNNPKGEDNNAISDISRVVKNILKPFIDVN